MALTPLGWWAAGAFAGINLLAFVIYAWDKRAARLGRRRVSELRLVLLAAAGGWLGAGLAMRFLRHKTRKQRFQGKLLVGLLLHAALLVFAFRLGLVGKFFVGMGPG